VPPDVRLSQDGQAFVGVEWKDCMRGDLPDNVWDPDEGYNKDRGIDVVR
jgi:hypothetical protein